MSSTRSTRPRRSAAAAGRRKSANTAANISASYYLGYVEDEETPEMIMKKFEELDRYEREVLKKNSSSTTGDGDDDEMQSGTSLKNKGKGKYVEPEPTMLTEEQQLELFKRTSLFSVESLAKEYEEQYIEVLVDRETGKPIYDDWMFEAGLIDNQIDGDYILNMDDMYDMDDDDDDDDDDDYEDEDTDDEEWGAGSKKSSSKRAKRERSASAGDDSSSGSEKPSRRKRVKDGSSSCDDNNRKKKRDKMSAAATQFVQSGKFIVRKKQRLTDPLEVQHVKIPPLPLPIPWGKNIKPFTTVTNVIPDAPTNNNSNNDNSNSGNGNNNNNNNNNDDDDDAEEKSNVVVFEYKEKNSIYLEARDLLHYFEDASEMKKRGTFEAILIDPPYDNSSNNKISPGDLIKKHLPIDRLVPYGYVFIWVEKEFTFEVVTAMEEINFVYVENFVWVKKNVNNTFHMAPSKYFQKSKLTLFIFKKDNEETRKMDIRHQRNPDVYFDFVRGERDRPEFVYHIIETLLPTAVSQNKLLELWGKRGHKPRPGWTRIVDWRV